MCVCVCIRVMSNQIVCTFHLVCSLSIQMFICISVGGCAGSWRAATAKVRRQAACCVEGCRGNVQTSANGGLSVKYRCWNGPDCLPVVITAR